MKRVLILIVLLATCGLFAQADLEQDANRLSGKVNPDPFSLYPSTVTSIEGDSVWFMNVRDSTELDQWSQVFKLYPWQWGQLTVADSGAIADLDSVFICVDLYQGMVNNTTKMSLVKRLLFHPPYQDSTAAAVGKIDTVGIWYCDFGEGTSPTGMPYSAVKVYGLLGNTKKTGLFAKFQVIGEIHGTRP